MMERDSVRYDPEADILYIHGRSGPAISEEVIPGVSVDVDEESGEILGIEICEASKVLAPLIESLQTRVKTSPRSK